MGQKFFAIVGSYARSLLTSMLKSKKPEKSISRNLQTLAVYSDYSALLFYFTHGFFRLKIFEVTMVQFFYDFSFICLMAVELKTEVAETSFLKSFIDNFEGSYFFK